jgi:NTP pyrophosphatase (non-canonical NTP hydrolase)
MSDEKVRVSELKQKVKDFAEARDWDQFHNAKDLAIGVITEASELLEHFRFKSVEEFEKMMKDPAKKESISEELADVLIFSLRFAQKYDIDVSSAIVDKLEKSGKKYPVEKAKGSNKKYNEF